MRKKILWLLVGCLVFICACGKEEQTVPGEEKNDTQMLNEKEEYNIKEYGGAVNGTGTYYYTGEETVIKYEYMAKGTGQLSVGIMLLCDGIALPFHTSEDETNAIIQIIPLETGKEKEIELYFVPYGKKGEVASLEIVDIFNADYDVRKGEKEDILSDFIHGLPYEIGYLTDINVNLNADGAVCEEKIYEKYSKEKIENYVSGDEEESLLEAEGTVNDEVSKWYTVEPGQPLDICIRYKGNVPEGIVTSLYVDGVLYSAFEGKGYAKCPVEEGNYTDIVGVIDTSGFDKGRHMVFSVCGNVKYNNVVPVTSFVFEVQ